MAKVVSRDVSPYKRDVANQISLNSSALSLEFKKLHALREHQIHFYPDDFNDSQNQINKPEPVN